MVGVSVTYTYDSVGNREEQDTPAPNRPKAGTAALRQLMRTRSISLASVSYKKLRLQWQT